MKTKLLRKLREKSKSKYWIETKPYYSSKPYILMGVDMCPYTIHEYEESGFEDAKKMCNEFRREYIEKYIKKRKKTTTTKIVY